MSAFDVVIGLIIIMCFREGKVCFFEFFLLFCCFLYMVFYC